MKENRQQRTLREAREREPDPYRRRFTFPKWNITVTVCEEPRLFRRLPEFDGWTKEQHEARAREFAAQAYRAAHKYRALADVALSRFGDGNGVYISGAYREHFPSDAKDVLRATAREQTECYDRSRAHWRAAGRRLETWRLMRGNEQ